MEQTYMTKVELKTAVNDMMKKASVKDQKWIYCYFNEMDEFPLVTDEVKQLVVRSKDW
tara:strand:+ start:423 stop:596 length:174 start_codon:yes stop_codon:yes gene_type:complete